MTAGHRYDPARAQRTLGAAVIETARRRAAEAPPLSNEVREQLRALFATTHPVRPAPRAA
ncbi:MAG: hypothetical protein LBV60_13800 [Streptomyces sp.]|jgi:hypothetical protein|nr:hypothetical protein [Streptomyces sp.]